MAKLLLLLRWSFMLAVAGAAVSQAQEAKAESPAEAFVLEQLSTKISLNADGTGTRETTAPSECYRTPAYNSSGC